MTSKAGKEQHTTHVFTGGPVSFTAEAFDGDAGAPVIVATAEDVDDLIDAIRAAPRRSLVALYIRERPLNAAGFPDHELGVGVDARAGVGVLSHLSPEGTWYTLGARSDHTEVIYYYNGHETQFPADSEVPLDLICQAAKEFLATAGQRPTCVPWQPYVPADLTPPSHHPRG